jgi:copper chaperone CopZ
MFKSISIALATIWIAAVSSATFADDVKPDTKTTSATYLITGLHCPACTKTVETSLAKEKGIRSIKVDWNNKNAKVEFDESVVPAERVAQLVAATPHMMTGMNLHYDGWLVLKAPDLKDDATAKKAKDAVSKIAGVKSVATFPAQHMVEVQFKSDGKATTKELIAALEEAGIKAETF